MRHERENDKYRNHDNPSDPDCLSIEPCAGGIYRGKSSQLDSLGVLAKLAGQSAQLAFVLRARDPLTPAC